MQKNFVCKINDVASEHKHASDTIKERVFLISKDQTTHNELYNLNCTTCYHLSSILGCTTEWGRVRPQDH